MHILDRLLVAVCLFFILAVVWGTAYAVTLAPQWMFLPIGVTALAAIVTAFLVGDYSLKVGFFPLKRAFQTRVYKWVRTCFGHHAASDVEARSHRFLEEALELAQSVRCTREEALELVDYVYGRPAGSVEQEVGGVMLTLHALCEAVGIDASSCGEYELERVWGKVEEIRAKNSAKPFASPLPGAYPEASGK